MVCGWSLILLCGGLVFQLPICPHRVGVGGWFGILVANTSPLVVDDSVRKWFYVVSCPVTMHMSHCMGCSVGAVILVSTSCVGCHSLLVGSDSAHCVAYSRHRWMADSQYTPCCLTWYSAQMVYLYLDTCRQLHSMEQLNVWTKWPTSIPFSDPTSILFSDLWVTLLEAYFLVRGFYNIQE